MRKALRPFAFVALAAALVAPLSNAEAQGEFTPGTKLLSVGLMDFGSTGFGGAFEVSVLELAPNIRLGIGATAGYVSHSSFGADATTLPLYANGNVHFAIPSVPQLDLFAGAAFGIIRTSVKVLGESVSDSDTGFGINIGGRYHFTEKLGAFAQIGLTDEVPDFFLGITFKF